MPASLARRGVLGALVGVGAAVVLPAQVALAAARQPWQRQDAVKGCHVLVSGCVLRFSEEEGWVSNGTVHLHRNEAHGAPGVVRAEIAQKDGSITMIQTVTGPHAHPTIGVFAQPDETLGGRMGIIAGATRGTGTTDFHLYDTRIGRRLDFRQKADRARIEGKFANLWVTLLHIDAASWGAGS